MEENRSLTHNMSPWNTRKLKLMINNNNNQECKSPNSKGNEEDKADQEEGHSENNGNKVDESSETRVEELSGRERLKRHREEVKGQVKVPENWEQEQMLKEWIDYTTFDALFAPHRMIVTARDALIADVRKARSQRLRIHT